MQQHNNPERRMLKQMILYIDFNPGNNVGEGSSYESCNQHPSAGFYVE